MLKHGASKEEQYVRMQNEITRLKGSLKAAEDERDKARKDNTVLAAWLRRNHPDAFREYFKP